MECVGIMLEPGLPMGCGLQWPPLQLCVVLFVIAELLEVLRISVGPPSACVLLVSPGSQRWTSSEESFPDPSQNSSGNAVCGAVAICWLLSCVPGFFLDLGSL